MPYQATKICFYISALHYKTFYKNAFIVYLFNTCKVPQTIQCNVLEIQYTGTKYQLKVDFAVWKDTSATFKTCKITHCLVTTVF